MSRHVTGLKRNKPGVCRITVHGGKFGGYGGTPVLRPSYALIEVIRPAGRMLPGAFR